MGSKPLPGDAAAQDQDISERFDAVRFWVSKFADISGHHPSDRYENLDSLAEIVANEYVYDRGFCDTELNEGERWLMRRLSMSIEMLYRVYTRDLSRDEIGLFVDKD